MADRPVRQFMRVSSARVLVATTFVVTSGCARKPEPAPAPVAAVAANTATHCAEVRARFKQYPNLMAEEEPNRLSGAFPRIAPARRDTAFTVSFVVDTIGKPVISTFSVSKHVGTKFTTELRKSAATWRYAPASAEGCKIARKVSHTIDTGRRR